MKQTRKINELKNREKCKLMKKKSTICMNKSLIYNTKIPPPPNTHTIVVKFEDMGCNKIGCC